MTVDETGVERSDALPRLFTLREVAEQTGFALRTLERDCRAGRVTHVHRGRDRLMTASQVELLIMTHTESPSVPIDTASIAAQQRLDRMRAHALRRSA